MIDLLTVAVTPPTLLAAAEPGLIPSLLTGGGFVFLAAIVTGLFLYNKSIAEGAKAVSEGATEVAENARKDAASARKDAEAAKAEARSANKERADIAKSCDQCLNHLAEVKAILRAVVRALDTGDTEAHAEAIARAKKLIG